MITSEFSSPLYFLGLEQMLTNGPRSTLISLNYPIGAADKLIKAVNKAAIIIQELSLSR
jgi:hypothetical protein